MLISNHRKVLACVVCGRLKSAFQIASRSGSVADVQYVAHQVGFLHRLQIFPTMYVFMCVMLHLSTTSDELESYNILHLSVARSNGGGIWFGPLMIRSSEHFLGYSLLFQISHLRL